MILLLLPFGNSFLLIPSKDTFTRYDTSHHVSVLMEQDPITDHRPHEQRTKGPRTARRLNHGFRYLYRHASAPFNDVTSFDYLRQYYSEEEIYRMNAAFPPLLGLNVSRHLHPKMRFLQETMGVANTSEMMQRIPPQYFGARLERIIAPRHAFLVYHGLPHGKMLVEEHPEMWQDFLISCRTTKRFCALCNQWRRKWSDESSSKAQITAKQIEAFDVMFGRGILAAARDEICQSNNTWPLEHVNISSAELVKLGLQHGASPLERDNRGSSLLHWAAGTGNLDAFKVLLPHFPKGILETTERDGATPLHWAVAGANSKEFGIGGHPSVCQYILSFCDSALAARLNITTKLLVNQLTKDGNSPLMWASWSGTLDTVKMLVRTRADHRTANRNGCTVAHWAASGGNLQVCKYLAEVVGVDFFVPNYGGNTPLTHAVAFGRLDVVQWLRERAAGSGENDEIAAALAEDFYLWTDGNERRRKVLQLFQDDYWSETDDDGAISINVAQKFELEQF